jgi:hypothetical protein
MMPGSSKLGDSHATFSKEKYHISFKSRFSGILAPPIIYLF